MSPNNPLACLYPSQTTLAAMRETELTWSVLLSRRLGCIDDVAEAEEEGTMLLQAEEVAVSSPCIHRLGVARSLSMSIIVSMGNLGNTLSGCLQFAMHAGMDRWVHE